MPEIDLEYLLADRRYSAVLRSFLEFLMQPECRDTRFWQALAAWSNYWVIGTVEGNTDAANNREKMQDLGMRDTFFWEGRRHDDKVKPQYNGTWGDLKP